VEYWYCKRHCRYRASRVGHGLDSSMDWIGSILKDILWIGWIGPRSRYFNVILIIIALPRCQCVQIFRLSFDVNCCITNYLAIAFITTTVNCQLFKMLNLFLLYKWNCFFAAEGLMDWIGCGSEHRHTSWIWLDWVSEFVNCVGLDLAKWTHVQLWLLETTCFYSLWNSGLLRLDLFSSIEIGRNT